jgi:hypothetical protein
MAVPAGSREVTVAFNFISKLTVVRALDGEDTMIGRSAYYKAKCNLIKVVLKCRDSCPVT